MTDQIEDPIGLRSRTPGTEPVSPAPITPALPQRVVKLVEYRPEVGLGIAFLGGLVLATILKRLGRR